MKMDKSINRIKPRDWLLIIGLMLAPMTGLRIWKIGPSELLCFIWGAKYILKEEHKNNEILRFFIVFLTSMLAGTLIGALIAPKELVITDWFTWLFIAFIALAIYEGLTENTVSYNEHLLYSFSIISTIWYIFLYFYSMYVSKSFLGAPLWYNGVRYSGGAQNPHQIAMLMCGLTFVFLRRTIKRKRPVISVLGIIGTIFIEIQTDSSTGVASIFVGFLTSIIILTFYKVQSAHKRNLIIFSEFLIGTMIIIFSYQILYEHFYEWLASDSNGLGRVELFSQIGNTFAKSPLFGLGPGIHALCNSGAIEYHNTYLEIIAASGIVGALSFIKLTVSTLRKLMKDATLIPILVSIYGYGLAGFAMRRLAYWGIFVFIFVISEQLITKSNDKCEIERRKLYS